MAAPFTIAFVPGVSPAKWVRVWRERFPDVELTLRAIGPTQVGAALEDGATMCFARLPTDDGLHAIPLWSETPVVATPKDSILAQLDTLTTRDLAGEHRIGDGPVPEDVDAALDLVEAGVGYAVLPQSLFRAASRKGLVARPLTDADDTRIALVWRDEDASDLTEQFIGVVRGRTANSSRGTERGPEAGPAPTAKPVKNGGKDAGRGGRTATRNGRAGGTRKPGGQRGRSSRRGR